MERFSSALASAMASNRDADGSLKLVILAGAGLSCDKPSGIPLGAPLTRFYLESCLGESVAHAMEKRWKQISAEMERSFNISFPSMRLESIIEKIDDVDREFGYKPFMEGFREFATVTPNRLHHHVASLMKCGAKLITPNFDCGVERALDSSFSGLHGDKLTLSYDDVLGVYKGDAGGCTVYHYHGAGTDPDKLGATVKRMLRGFKAPFGDLLCQWFDDGYSLLCVGFGCVDYFDATQFFESVPHGRFPGTAVFCKHHADGPFEIGGNEIAKYESFIRGFREQRLVYGFTEGVLAELVRLTCGECEVKRNEAAVGLAERATPAFDWKQGFERLLAEECRDTRMYLIRLMNQFGFYLTDKDVVAIRCEAGEAADCGSLGPLAYYRTCEDVLRGASADFLACVKRGGGVAYFLDGSRFPTQSRSIGFDFKMICRDMGHYPDEATSIGKLYDEASRMRMAQDVCVGLQGGGTIGCDAILRAAEERGAVRGGVLATKYVVAFKDITEALTTCAIRNGIDAELGASIKEACDCADALMALPLGRFMFSSHRLSICKMHNLLHVLRGDDDSGLVPARELAELAMQICLTDEPPRIYRHQALICMLRLMGFSPALCMSEADRTRYSHELIEWKNKTEAYLGVLKVAGAWKLNNPWLEAVEMFLAASSPKEPIAREAALMLIGDATEQAVARILVS